MGIKLTCSPLAKGSSADDLPELVRSLAQARYWGVCRRPDTILVLDPRNNKMHLMDAYSAAVSLVSVALLAIEIQVLSQALQGLEAAIGSNISATMLEGRQATQGVHPTPHLQHLTPCQQSTMHTLTSGITGLLCIDIPQSAKLCQQASTFDKVRFW